MINIEIFTNISKLQRFLPILFSVTQFSCSSGGSSVSTEADQTPTPVPVLDSTAPQASIKFPTQYSYTNKPQIIIHGLAHDDQSDIASIEINGVRATSSDGYRSWQTRVSLVEGVNELVLSAEDSHGNVGNEVQTIWVKYEAPVLDLTDLVVDSATNKAYLLDGNSKTVFSVNLVAGVKSLSNNTTAGGTAFIEPQKMELDSNNNRLLIQDDGFDLRGIVSVDLATGERNLIGSYASEINSPEAMTLDVVNNRLLICETQAVYSFDLISGAVVTLS